MTDTARPGAGSPGPVGRLVDAVVDRGVVPDRILRTAIRLLLRRRLAAAGAGASAASQQARKQHLIEELSSGPVTEGVDAANAQHYEVPTGLFELMLGPHLKYSSAYWPTAGATLADAEEAMLRLTCRRAGLVDGQDVLELGCGWGSLTLWIAERFPASTITAVSNSAGQAEHIRRQARERGLDNVRPVTCDVGELGTGPTGEVVAGGFDRIVSVEMVEHVRNHRALLARIAAWLRPDGRLFVHHFAHRTLAYPFDVGGGGDWMARHFFTGGMMPSDDLLLHVADGLAVDGHWLVDGTHYARTLRAWLDRLDRRRDRAVDVLADRHGRREAVARVNRWRVFLMACEELFATDAGRQWLVTHLRFRPARRRDPRSAPGDATETSRSPRGRSPRS